MDGNYEFEPHLLKYVRQHNEAVYFCTKLSKETSTNFEGQGIPFCLDHHL
jgi:hypothetical protein